MPIFNLTMRGALHQGEFVGINRETAREWIPSDSLFAMLVAGWVQRGSDAATRLKDFVEGKPPFVISSAFPRAGAVRFYPAPQRWGSKIIDAKDSKDNKPGKALKKIRWISQGVLNLLNDQAVPPIEADNFLHDKTAWWTDEERQRASHLLEINGEGKAGFWDMQVVPHVTVDRSANSSNLFHTGRVVYAKECGLWFAVRGDATWVSESLKYLADAGLGGLRSTGHGAFTADESNESLPAPSTGEWGLSLSRYAPLTLDEVKSGLQNEKSAYKLVTVGGWCVDDDGNSWRRKSVRLVAEGAFLPASAKGKLVDVKPDGVMKRPVYRNGFAFLIPAEKMAEEAA